MPPQHLRDPNDLSLDEIELIEKQSIRSLYQATIDFGFEAYDIFRQSTDNVTEVGEDITREILDRIGGFQVQPSQRLYGNVDYRKARYVILPEYMIRQALFVDSKAEKHRSTATLQMSQLSMRVRQTRTFGVVDIPGKLPMVSEYNAVRFLTTTLLSHYFYSEVSPIRTLLRATLIALPNGRLQNLYNPNADDSIWRAGRSATTLGEEFRVRLSFEELWKRKSWRVQHVLYKADERVIEHDWRD